MTSPQTPTALPATQTRGGKNPDLAPVIVVAVMILAFGIVFSWLSLARHEAFQSHAFDLGNMDQAVWNTLHGRLLRFTDMAVGRQVLTTRLAIHVEPILFPVSLLYLIHAGPETLLVLQAWVVAFGALPAYLLARRVICTRWLALVFPASYLLHPSVQNAVLDDFHPVTLSACFLLWALYALYVRSISGFAIASLLAMATKEDVGLLVAFMGIVLLARSNRAAGIATVAIGLCWFFISVEVLIPGFNPSRHSPYLARYAYLGHGLAGVILAPFKHPSLVWHVLTSRSRLAFLDDLLHPLGYVSILGLPVLLLALPALAIDLLSADPRMYSGFYQYPMELIPFVVAGAIVGTGLVLRLARSREVIASQSLPFILCALVLLGSVVDTWRYGFSPVANGYVAPSAGPHQRLERTMLSRIPEGTVISAADEIEPHLSDRRSIYLMPMTHPSNGSPARYIVLDASIPSSPIRPKTLQRGASQALHSGYSVDAAQDGILVLRRGKGRKTLPQAFFSFMYQPPPSASRMICDWGPLRLLGITIHPRSLQLNRSRPAVGLETYWQASRRLSAKVRIQLFMSPVYHGVHPSFSRTWEAEGDSPAWDWVPIGRWPLDRPIKAVVVPLAAPADRSGRVDLAVGVSGSGSMHTFLAHRHVAGATDLIRLATLRVGY